MEIGHTFYSWSTFIGMEAGFLLYVLSSAWISWYIFSTLFTIFWPIKSTLYSVFYWNITHHWVKLHSVQKISDLINLAWWDWNISHFWCLFWYCLLLGLCCTTYIYYAELAYSCKGLGNVSMLKTFLNSQNRFSVEIAYSCARWTPNHFCLTKSSVLNIIHW